MAAGPSYPQRCWVFRALANLPTPSSLPVTKREAEYPNALERAGRIVPFDEAFQSADLADGRYVYLIGMGKDGPVVVWSLEALASAEGNRNLVTHTALTNQLAVQLGNSAEIVGAGEATIENGRGQMLSNRAGTRRGGPEHLSFAERVLSAKGFPFESATLRKDYSKETYTRRHLQASQRATFALRVEREPELKELKLVLLDINRRLFAGGGSFCDPNLPGKINESWIFDRKRIENKLGRELTPAEHRALHMLREYLIYGQRQGFDLMAIRAQEHATKPGTLQASFQLVAP